MIKQNDWIVAGINNPDFSTNDFLISGLNVENTQLLTKDQYKQSPFIKETFTQNESFDEKAFDNYYEDRAKEYGILQTFDSESTSYIYSPFDPRAKQNQVTMSPDFELKIVANPNKETQMLTGAVYSDNLSTRERSQQKRIWDTEKGEWMDYSVNDISLFNNPVDYIKSIFSDPLVYATYDEDGEHYDQFSGQVVQHKKGQYKLDEYGSTYVETLNGRSTIGKEVVSMFDYITVDDEGINKYDFFDSDSLDKSVAGVVMKTVVSVAPLFLGGPVSYVYSGLLVVRELAKSLPMLYGISTSLFDVPEDNSVLNTIAAKAQSFTTGISDSGKKSILNTETVFNMISDIALQFGQQRVIANTINKLRGSKNLTQQAHAKASMQYQYGKSVLESQYKKGHITKESLEKYIGNPDKWYDSVLGKSSIEKYMKEVEPIIQRSKRLGADASLIYMALVSNTDVYDSMIQAGASRKEAAAVALGSTIGMFGVDRYLHLGELFFDDLTASYEHQIRRTLTKEAQSWYTNVVKQGAKSITKSQGSKIKQFFQAGIESGRKATSSFVDNLKYHSTGFLGKSFGEGLEEVGEELVADFSKGIYELAGDLGADTTVKDVGAFDNILARYGMSFLGGSLGGGLFYGVDLYQNGRFNIDTTQDELIYLIRNGRTNEVLKTLESWKRKGKLGSTSLSTTVEKDSDGNNIFVSATKPGESQNDFIYNRIKETVLSLQNIINENGANLSEDQLFDRMILSESRFRDLEKYLDIQNYSYTTGYQRDYQKIISKISDLELGLKRANQTITGINYTREEDFQANLATDEALRNLTEEEKNSRKENLQKIKDDLEEVKKELNKFLSGEYSIEYTEKMLFALDDHLNSEFIAMNYVQWLKQNHDGKTPEELSPAEAVQYKQEYLNYKRLAQEKELTRKFAIYKYIKEQMNPILSEIQDGSEQFKTFQTEIENLFNENSPLSKLKQYQYDDVLDFIGETKDSDSYIYRYELDENDIESREKAISDYNNKQLEDLQQGIQDIINKSGGFIDPITRRKLKLILNSRNKDIAKGILKNISIDISRDNVSQELNDLDITVLKILETETNNGSVNNEALSQIRQAIIDHYKKSFISQNQFFEKLFGYLLDNGVINSEIVGSEISQWVEFQIGKGKTIDEIFNVDSGLFTDDYDLYELTKEDVQNYLSQLKKLYNDGILEDYEQLNIDLDEESLLNNQIISNEIIKYSNIFGQYEKNLYNNSILKLNNWLDSSISEINPVIKLIQSLGLSLNKDMTNLESILRKIDERYETLESSEDLILTDDEKESLEEAEYILKLADSYLYAASNAPNPLFPYSHNIVLNEFAENHKDIYKDFKQLPVLSKEIAFMYSQELSKYLEQIGIFDERTKKYNVGSYRWLSSQNEIDKARQYTRADRAWSKTIYDILTKKDAFGESIFKFEYEGRTIDLLEGTGVIPVIDESTTDAAIYLNHAFNAFHNKIQQLKSEGWSYRDIWKRSGLLKKLAILENVPNQKTCSLDEDITVDRMTDYDKVIFIATIGAMDSTKFYSYLYERIKAEDKIAPLTIQEWVSRVGIALTENPEIFNDTLEYIKSETGTELPIIYNSVYASGNAGAGKSRVVARNVVLYNNEGEIWLSAPKESQINTLYESTSKGIKMLNRDSKNTSEEFPILMEQIGVDQKIYNNAFQLISDYKHALQKIQDPNQDTSFLTITETESSFVININPSKFGIKKIDNPPSVIVIDEATHLSNLELQLLSYFAKLNNTKLFFLGDNKQRGFEGFGRNLERNQCLMIRTPNLGISLRDNNIQHQANLNILEEFINQLSNLNSKDPSYQQQVNAIRSQIKNIKFRSYTLDDIHGEVITSKLTKDTASKMKGSVGYVGSPNSNTLTVLKEAGLEPVVMAEVDIQGQEFDYVVIDKDFTIPSNSEGAIFILEFLQDLYTMISRGRNGSIIIDSSGVLQNAIGENRVENTTTKATDISAYTKDFREEKINKIERILKNESKSEDLIKPPTKPTESVNLNDKLIFDSEFDYNSLDFGNNYYFLVPYSQDLNELESGIDISQHSLGEFGFLADESIIKKFINESKEKDNPPYGILYKFPKSDFGDDINNTENISQKLEQIEGQRNILSNKFIDYIIEVIPEEKGDDEKTDDSEKQNPPEQDDDLEEFFDGVEGPFNINQEDIPETPILCFGEATFTGMQVELVDGKQVWINPKTSEKRDGQIFSSEERITETKDQIEISNKIRALKHAFLYRKEYKELSEDITKLISEEAFNSVEWFIEAREKNNQDNFIRNIAFKEVLPIGSKNLIFTVVGKIKLNDGTFAKITLGLMRDPNVWKKEIKQKTPQNRITNKIKKLQKKLNHPGLSKKEKDSINKQIKYYEDQLKTLDLDDANSIPNKYAAYIEKLSAEYKGSPVIKPITKLITPGLTDLHRQKYSVQLFRRSSALIKNAENRLMSLKESLKKVKGSSITKAQILSEIANTEARLAEFKKINDYSFYSLNPYTVKSPMYIYTPTRTIRSNSDIDDSLVGKYCVIFVSNDKSLNPEELVNVYISQKNQTDLERKENGNVDLKSSKVIPSVRMIVLNTLGVSFQDMSNPYLSESMKSEISYIDTKGNKVYKTNIYPFKTNFMGVRMYVGLWNFRANLLQFKKYFSKFVEILPQDIFKNNDGSLNNQKLDEYLIVKDLKWRQENGKQLSSEDLDYLSKHSTLEKFDEVSKLIDDFNSSLGNKVKQFRLGSDLQNGAYIRRLTGNIQSLYAIDESKVNGIYLNSSVFEKFLNISESLFSNVLNHIVTCDLNPDRLLSTKKGVKNSFANHITSIANTNGQIVMKDSDSGEETIVNFGSSYDPSNSRGILNTFSHIPAVLSKVFKYTSLRQRHINASTFDVKNDYSIKITGSIQENGKDVSIEREIPYYKLWKHVDMINMIDEYDSSLLDGYEFDPILSNFFSFAFHGTLQNIQDRDVQRSSDALFPLGFFADPMSTADAKEVIYNGSEKMFVKAMQQGIFFGSDVKVEDPTFFISLQNLDENFHKDKERGVVQHDHEYKEQCDSILDQLIKDYPELFENFENIRNDINSLSGKEKIKYLEAEVKSLLIGVTKNNYDTLFKGTNRSIEPNLLVHFVDWKTAKTLGQYISTIYHAKFNKYLPKITNIKTDNGSLIVEAGDVTIKVTKGLSDTINIEQLLQEEIPSETVVTIIQKLMENISEDLDEVDIEQINDKLEVYKQADSSVKIKAKEQLIKVLKGIDVGFNVDLFNKIDDAIKNIRDLNC